MKIQLFVQDARKVSTNHRWNCCSTRRRNKVAMSSGNVAIRFEYHRPNEEKTHTKSTKNTSKMIDVMSVWSKLWRAEYTFHLLCIIRPNEIFIFNFSMHILWQTDSFPECKNKKQLRTETIRNIIFHHLSHIQSCWFQFNATHLVFGCVFLCVCVLQILLCSANVALKSAEMSNFSIFNRNGSGCTMCIVLLSLWLSKP